MWSDHYRTPRYVWCTSAIAATLLHGALVGWGLYTWRNSLPTLPAPIRVLAVPASPASAIAADSPIPVPEIAAAPPTEQGTPLPQVEPAVEAPVPPNDAYVEPDAAPIPDQSTATEVAPAPAPVSPAPEATSDGYRPEIPEPGWSIESSESTGDRPYPTTTGEINRDDQANIASSSSVQPVPGGADLPEELPRTPPGWEQAVADLVARSACAEGLVQPGVSAQVAVWPVVEADGTISEFLSWDGNQNPELASCVESLRVLMPPLIPAREGGVPIASYGVLVVIDLTLQ